jgi:hypothetical protein
LFAQVCVILGFVIIAMGSASAEKTYQSYNNSDASYYIKSVGEGLNESNSGRKLIGKATSKSDCYEKAENAGCSGQYSYYEHSEDCYCN